MYNEHTIYSDILRRGREGNKGEERKGKERRVEEAKIAVRKIREFEGEIGN